LLHSDVDFLILQVEAAMQTKRKEEEEQAAAAVVMVAEAKNKQVL